MVDPAIGRISRLVGQHERPVDRSSIGIGHRRRTQGGTAGEGDANAKLWTATGMCQIFPRRTCADMGS